MATEVCDDLFPETRNPACTLAINDRCLIRTQNDHRVVVVGGMTLAQYHVHDSMSEALAMVSLVEQGWADQNDVARAFGRSARTVRRYQSRFEDGGLSALGSSDGYPKGRPRLAATQTQLIQRLKASGHSNREIAGQVGVSEMAIRKSLRRMGWREPEAQGRLPLSEPEGANPNLSAFFTTTMAVPLAAGPKSAVVVVPTISADLNPADRRVDRFLARVGLLQDAAPVFGSAKHLPRAGVLLAVPALVQTGVFICAQKVYQSLGPAFYGLRTSILTLLLMALWRIKRSEAIKEHCPEALGKVLGLDRAPEVKTLRRKLTRLAAAGHAAQFGQALAQERVAQHASALGFLYVDGHVRVYHGQRRLPKTHVARMRLSMPANTDYWVND